MDTTFFDFKLFKVGDIATEAQKAQGKNQKGLMIFFEAPEEESPAIIGFLAKILQAIKLDLEQDTLFINRMPDQPLKIVDLLKKNNCRQVLIFGIPPAELGIRFALPHYINVAHQDVKYLAADALMDIFAERQDGGKEMSGKLWKAIQQFELS